MKNFDLAKNISNRMTELEIKSARQLAARCSFSDGVIKKILAGNTINPRIDSLIEIAEVLGGSVDSLITGIWDDSKSPPSPQSNEYLIDQELLEASILVIDEYITNNKLELTSHQKSAAISALYELTVLNDDTEINPTQIQTILRLIQ